MCNLQLLTWQAWASVMALVRCSNTTHCDHKPVWFCLLSCSALRPQAGAQALPAGVDAALSRCRATVCSYLFWPELPEHDLKLPQELHTALEVRGAGLGTAVAVSFVVIQLSGLALPDLTTLWNALQANLYLLLGVTPWRRHMPNAWVPQSTPQALTQPSWAGTVSGCILQAHLTTHFFPTLTFVMLVAGVC